MVVNVGNSEPRDDEREEVWLAGKGPYDFVFPKVAPIMAAMRKAARTKDEQEKGLLAMDAQEKWLAAGFGDNWQDILNRLEDMNDYLDWPHLIEAFDQLFELAGGRPPT